MLRTPSSSKILILLFALTAISIAGLSLLAIRNRQPSNSAQLLWAWGFGFILAWWVRVDARVRGYLRVFDFDAFVFFGWPVMLPYYLYRTRRARGLFAALGIYSLYFVPDTIAQIVRLTASR